MRYIVEISGEVLKPCHRSMEIYANSEEHAREKATRMFTADQNGRGKLQHCEVDSITQVGKSK